MTATLDMILNDALALSDHERASLAARLLDSLDSVDDDAAWAAWAVEIKRRLDEVNAGTAVTHTSDEVMTYARARVRAGREG
ncbi:MAG: putative addiction module component (TIGR02574 family) [Myxococcota bacterium]|jgi:putative addiction module component (TIGR02574 family)